jgi:predicted exporter
MNLVPPEIRQAESELQQTWGNLRGRAVAFVEGKDLQAALAANDRLFTFLAARLPAGDIVSLAPIFPSAAVQASNRQAWSAFWGGDRGQIILQALRTEAAPLGFAPDAFAPFLQQLSTAPPVIDAEGLRQAGLGEALAALVIEESNRVRLLTLLPDTPAVAALFAGAAPGGAHLVSQAQFGITISRAVERDFARYLVVTSLVVTLLVAALFRRPAKILLTLVPAVTGLTVMTGIMGALGIAFNLFNIVATVLVLGLCVDYGIYIVCRVTEGTDHAADRAVLVSGLTTLAGFGILVLASHPALHSIGISVLLGIGAAIPAALLVIPALRPEGVE